MMSTCITPYSVLCTVYTVHCVQCTVYSVHCTAPVASRTAGIPVLAGTSWASVWGWSFSGGGPGRLKVIQVKRYGYVIRTLDMV